MSPLPAKRADSETFPTEEDAAAIFRASAGHRAVRVRRFPTGLANYVFDVGSDRMDRVVRIAACRGSGTFKGAIYWSNRLRPLGVPLPEIFDAGSHNGFEYLVLERLPGSDLCHVYGTMSAAQKQQIAAGVVQAQMRVREMPAGNGYGYVSAYEASFPHSTWRGVVEENLARSRLRIRETRVVDSRLADKIELRMEGLRGYLNSVPPLPFMDDTTTKNVICEQGRLSGIVDVDEICFGDSLFTPALTRAALLADGQEVDYVDFWIERLSPGAQARSAFHLYTALFCLDLISESGQRFNRAAPAQIDYARIQRLMTAIDRSLSAEEFDPCCTL
jgi:Ser/Thr protein kinase RdoA (MazF antagonist)